MKNVFVCILLIIFNVCSYGQKSSLIIANVEIKLGITKDKFVDLIPPSLTLRPDETRTAYFIEKNEVLYGSVQFDDDNKAFIISKEYLTGKESLFEVINEFYDLLNTELVEKKLCDVKMMLNEINEPNNKTRYISISKGNWDVSININKINNLFFYGLQENITAFKFKKAQH